MKATGIVRRIDDLGRVVIPKEIRRTMRIREGDPLEIYTSASGEVIFKKYSPMGEMSGFAAQYAESLAEATRLPVIICDRDHCVAAAGISKKEVLERRVTPSLEEIMEQRRSVSFGADGTHQALEGVKRPMRVSVPILNAGDVSGAVVLVADEAGTVANETDVKLASVAAAFLGRQME
ncbi:MAG: AbrB/MazE/SpoVT family DNA-binding domain-containing protein [Clostridia bacterium]|nr:AbrB/MazE/SpoVT family DNA-binding domain-containing protein [Clostridia bacterium]